MLTDEIKKELFGLQDTKYRDFQARLIPTVPASAIIGVRTPLLRKLAKQMAKRDGIDSFLDQLPHQYFDEDQLHAFIISDIRDFGQCVSQVERFLPFINNWATCDQMSPKVFKKNRQELLGYIKDWIASDKTYVVRFAIGMLMEHFLDEEFDIEYLEMVSKVHSEEYYIHMMAAWYYATALAKQYDAALPFLEGMRLEPWVHNKAIQKSVESNRIPPERKAYLKTLKVSKLTQFSRTELLLGKEAMEKLSGSRVAVFGIGGVGGYACEALVRSGVGAFDLIDDDKVCLTNLNRQIIATQKTVGRYKVEVMKERMLEINPKADVRIHKCFFLPENADGFRFEEYDYIVDAVDTVTAKIELAMKAQAKDVPIISSMGAGNKLDGSQFRVADIYKTKVCPLAKVMRRELKKRGVKKLKVVYSEEEPTRPSEDMSASCTANCICPPGAKHKCTERRDIPGSVAFVPSVAGLIIAGEVVKDLCRAEILQ